MPCAALCALSNIKSKQYAASTIFALLPRLRFCAAFARATAAPVCGVVPMLTRGRTHTCQPWQTLKGGLLTHLESTKTSPTIVLERWRLCSAVHFFSQHHLDSRLRAGVCRCAEIRGGMLSIISIGSQKNTLKCTQQLALGGATQHSSCKTFKQCEEWGWSSQIISPQHQSAISI